jgi:hypothetical protein
MARKPKRPRARRLKRNPVARALSTGRFRKRVVEPRDAYRRRPKHAPPPDPEGEER